MAKTFRWKIRGRKLVISLLILTAGALVLGGAALHSRENWSSDLNHEQEVWLHALEWCESSGIPSKINPKDLDGTPSYHSFQFKPSTFKAFGIKYGIFDVDISDEEIESRIADYDLQKKMVSFMINDRQVRWQREFPGCVRRLGPPPIKK